MRKVGINIYKFDELFKDTQEKLIEVQMQDDCQYYCDYNLEYDMENIAKDLLKDTFKNVDYKGIYYNLDYCQGDGAMIEFDMTLKDINNKYKMLSDDELKQIENIGYTDIEVRHLSNYYGASSFNVEYQDYTFYIDNFDEIQDKLDDMMIKFEDDIKDMNDKLKKKGYNLLDECNTRENAIETLRGNEYFKDGTIYNCDFTNINNEKESD